MSLLYIDSFESYSYLPLRWDYAWNSTLGDQFTIVSGIGRTGDNALQINSYIFQTTEIRGYNPDVYDSNLEVPRYIEALGLGKIIPETNDVIIGFAYMPRTGDRGYLNLELIKDGVVQSIIKYRREEVSFADNNNNILVTHNNLDNLNRKLLYHQQWGYIEVYVSFGGTSSGTVSIRANEYLSYTGTGLQTAISGDSINEIKFYLDHDQPTAPFIGEYSRLDDLYIANTSGTINNSFLGNINVNTIYPVSSGTYSDFTLSSGTSSGTEHYTQVNNNTLIPDTTTHSDTYWITDGLDDGGFNYGVNHIYFILYRHQYNRAFFRFSNVNIPRRAKITRAQVFLTRQANNGTEVSLQHWYGYDTGYTEFGSVFDIDSWEAAPKTKMSSVNAAATNDPDVTQTLQQLVNRPDWVEQGGAFTLLLWNGRYDGTGNYTQWRTWNYDSGGASTPYIEIDWEYPQADGTYVQTTTTGTIDTFKYDTTSVSGSDIIGLQHNMVVGANDHGVYYERMYYNEKMLVSGTEYDSTPVYINDTQTGHATAYSYAIKDYNPETNNHWTVDEVANLELGITTISGYYGATPTVS